MGCTLPGARGLIAVQHVETKAFKFVFAFAPNNHRKKMARSVISMDRTTRLAVVACAPVPHVRNNVCN